MIICLKRYNYTDMNLLNNPGIRIIPKCKNRLIRWLIVQNRTISNCPQMLTNKNTTKHKTMYTIIQRSRNTQYTHNQTVSLRRLRPYALRYILRYVFLCWVHDRPLCGLSAAFVILYLYSIYKQYHLTVGHKRNLNKLIKRY